MPRRCSGACAVLGRCATFTAVLGVFHINADAGILKACRNGGITEISTVEKSYANYFFWQRTICIVNVELCGACWACARESAV